MKKLHMALLLFLLAGLGIAGYLYPDPNVFVSLTEAKTIPVIVIDPGHGGEDGGAVSQDGRRESEYNLDIALKTDLVFRLLGYRTVMTRTEDISLHSEDAKSIRQKKVSDLHNRLTLINEIPNAVLLSLHQNKFSQAKYRGAQVFYNKVEDSKALAEIVQDALQEGLDSGNNRQPRPLDVLLMNETLCPGILVECGFLSNAQDEQNLRDPKYQVKLAAVLAVSITEWVTLY